MIARIHPEKYLYVQTLLKTHRPGFLLLKCSTALQQRLPTTNHSGNLSAEIDVEMMASAQSC